MGVSTDGILAFGVDLGHPQENGLELPWHRAVTEDEDEDEDEYSFEDWLADLAGASTKEIWEHHYAWMKQHPEHLKIGSSDQVRLWEAEYPEMSEALTVAYKKRREAEAACPIELVFHAHGDYLMEIIAVRGTVTKASRGSPKVIESLDVPLEKIGVARTFCAKHNIPFEDPKWLLASIWW